MVNLLHYVNKAKDAALNMQRERSAVLRLILHEGLNFPVSSLFKLDRKIVHM